MSEPHGIGPIPEGVDSEPIWALRLYVAGQTARSMTAFANLKSIAEEFLPGRHRIEVIDLLKNPQVAEEDRILAVPTLVRRLPAPSCRIVGDLSDTEQTLIGLNLLPLALGAPSRAMA